MQVYPSRCLTFARPLSRLQLPSRYNTTTSTTSAPAPEVTPTDLIAQPRKTRRFQHPGGITSPQLALETTRKRTKAEKYFARVARDDLPPSKLSKRIGYASWIICGVLGFYMVLYVDFGEKEHIFSPIRRKWKTFQTSLSTLSPEERAIMEASKRPVNDGKPA